jgi:hypothetical protein
MFHMFSCTSINTVSKIELHQKYAHGGPLVPREAFNNYQIWFDRYYPTDQKLDMTITVRVRAFGQQEDKQTAGDKEWRTKHPDWGPVPSGITVSSHPIEIWMDLKQDKLGNMIIPTHVLGHEMEHALILDDSRIENPHMLVEACIYEIPYCTTDQLAK